jgi:hypothetical protein
VIELLIGPVSAGLITVGVATAGGALKRSRDRQVESQERYEALSHFVAKQHEISVQREQAMEVALTRVGTGLEHVVDALKQSSIEAREDRREIYARLGRVENRVSSVETHLELTTPRRSKAGRTTSLDES